MAVKIRLARHGAKKHPYYRVVVIDSRARRDGRVIEEVGRYNPNVEPAMVTLDIEKIDAWIGKGAQLTETTARLLKGVRENGNTTAAPAAEQPAEPAKPEKIILDKKEEPEAEAPKDAEAEEAKEAPAEDAADKDAAADDAKDAE
ncbi:MAG: 30S ribosomal protein S16 [Coriobacteriales bacterium]|nr:30S ribosomal protein S16 [Coriobacteriales bacterium]